jgi:PhnB protein
MQAALRFMPYQGMMVVMTDSSLQPRLVIAGAAKAIDFYKRALDAEEIRRFENDSGKIAYGELSVGGAIFNLKDEGDGDVGPTSLGGSPVFLLLNVQDADATIDRMVREGADIVYEVSDGPGGRGGRVRDPFGHIWMIYSA